LRVRLYERGTCAFLDSVCGTYPGVFSLRAPAGLQQLLPESGFVEVEQPRLALSLGMPSATDAPTMMQVGLCVSRAVVAVFAGATQVAARTEVERHSGLETTSSAFVASGEMPVASGDKQS
jgi:hypothetical protein